MSTTKVRALKPPKSVFNLSYEKKFDFDFGQLIPVACEEMVPGDTFKVGNEMVIRFNPLFAPILQEINATVHYFFVPTRLIFDDWEKFITGGEDGNDSTVLPRFQPDLGSATDWNLICGPYSLYDYFGFPVKKIPGGSRYGFPGELFGITSPYYFYRPLAFPWRAYNLIWNEFYRDENLQSEVSLDNYVVLNRNWHKDYFTSALEDQQRGVAPAISMKGFAPVVFPPELEDGVVLPNSLMAGDVWNVTVDANTGITNASEVYRSPRGGVSGANNVTQGVVDLSAGVGIDVSEMRLAFQMQKWMERNMRAGVRYTEFLHAHYGVSPRDDRLQRPEYLGGSKSPIIVSEVVQTANDGSSLVGTGSQYGKAITADRNFICTYHAKEFGYLVGILSVMPKATYQQGIDRKWLRKSRFDFYSPEFAHLSEQPITNEEIFAFTGNSDNGSSIDPKGNGDIFGYQAVWNEMRANQSKVCGALRDSLDFWHLGRQFSTLPQLNSDFITVDATRDDLKRIFQVPSVPGMICNFANIITAIRPLPKFGEPGLIDHD